MCLSYDSVGTVDLVIYAVFIMTGEFLIEVNSLALHICSPAFPFAIKIILFAAICLTNSPDSFSFTLC